MTTARSRLAYVAVERIITPPYPGYCFRLAGAEAIDPQQLHLRQVRQLPPVVLKAVIGTGPQSTPPLTEHHRPAVFPQVFRWPV